MDKHEKEQLLYLLEKLFAEYDINARNATHDHPAFQLIKNEMMIKGRWKKLPRGHIMSQNLNPQKRY